MSAFGSSLSDILRFCLTLHSVDHDRRNSAVRRCGRQRPLKRRARGRHSGLNARLRGGRPEAFGGLEPTADLRPPFPQSLRGPGDYRPFMFGCRAVLVDIVGRRRYFDDGRQTRERWARGISAGIRRFVEITLSSSPWRPGGLLHARTSPTPAGSNTQIRSPSRLQTRPSGRHYLLPSTCPVATSSFDASSPLRWKLETGSLRELSSAAKSRAKPPDIREILHALSELRLRCVHAR